MLAFNCCFSRTMVHIPMGQRVAFVSSLQAKYSKLLGFSNAHLTRLTNGDFTISYLNEPTILTEPADYLAFEIRQTMIDINSKKSRLGASILGNCKGYGALFPRDETREMVKENLGILRQAGVL